MSKVRHFRLAAALVISVGFWAPAGGAAEPPPQREPHVVRVLVLPFESLSADPDSDAPSVRALTRSLSFDLPAAPFIECSTGEKVAADDAAALAAARADGARFVVRGTVQRVADRIRVSGRVLDAEAGGAAGRFKLTGAADELFELQDAVAEQVERRVLAAVTPRPPHAAPGAGATDGVDPDHSPAPVEVPPSEPLRVRPRQRGDAAADWAAPPGRRGDDLTYRYNFGRVPYRFLPYGYGYFGNGGYGYHCRPHHGYRHHFGDYTYEGIPDGPVHHYGPGGLGSFHGPVPLRWYGD